MTSSSRDKAARARAAKKSSSPETPGDAQSDRKETGTVRIRARAGLIGVGAVILTTILVTQAELVLSTLRIGYLQMPPIAIAMMLAVMGLSKFGSKLNAKWKLTSADLLVIYCMVLVSAMVTSHGVVEKFIPQLVAPHYFATPQNSWHKFFDLNLNHRLVPYDPSVAGPQRVVDEFFTGTPRGQAIPWKLWLLPVLNWGVLISLLVAAFLFMTTLLRKQWVENEHLSFPLAQLPIELAGAEGGTTEVQRKLMWLGALIPAVIYTNNAIHQVYPTVPSVPLIVVLNDYFTQPPFNNIGWCPLMISFAAIGFFFLLPTDISLSIWFFFVLQRLQEVAGNYYDMSMPAMPIYPPRLFIGYETMGAYVVLTGYLFWTARTHLKGVWNAAIGRATIDDSNEAIPYRFAFWGLLACVFGSAFWLWSMGMSLWLGLFEIVVFVFMIAIIMARSTAEGGMLMTETTFRPIDLYRMFGSVHALGPQNLALLAMVDNIVLRDQRGLLLTGFLDSTRIGDAARIDRKALLRRIIGAVALAFLVAVPLNIFLSYSLGADKLDPYLTHQQPQFTLSDYAPFFTPGQSDFPESSSWQMPVFFSVGALATLGLTVLRATFYWWPLHPLGLALSGSWAAVEFWFPCLVAWVIKSNVVRYGGTAGYTKIRPLFLGLVLGECLMAVICALLSILFHIPPPIFPWA